MAKEYRVRGNINRVTFYEMAAVNKVIVKDYDFKQTFSLALNSAGIFGPSSVPVTFNVYGISATAGALQDGLLDGFSYARARLSLILAEEMYRAVMGRLRQLGMFRTGKFLSKGKNPRPYTRYGRLPPSVRLALFKGHGRDRVVRPQVSIFTDMGNRRTNSGSIKGAPHSVFVEYGFTDKAGKKHAPRPIFKLLKANLPSIKALAIARARNDAIKVISSSVNSKLKKVTIRS